MSRRECTNKCDTNAQNLGTSPRLSASTKLRTSLGRYVRVFTVSPCRDHCLSVSGQPLPKSGQIQFESKQGIPCPTSGRTWSHSAKFLSSVTGRRLESTPTCGFEQGRNVRESQRTHGTKQVACSEHLYNFVGQLVRTFARTAAESPTSQMPSNKSEAGACIATERCPTPIATSRSPLNQRPSQVVLAPRFKNNVDASEQRRFTWQGARGIRCSYARYAAASGAAEEQTGTLN